MRNHKLAKILLENTISKIDDYEGECCDIYSCPLQKTLIKAGYNNLFEKPKQKLMDEIGLDFFDKNTPYSICYIVTLYFFVKILGLSFQKAQQYCCLLNEDDRSGLDMCISADVEPFIKTFFQNQDRVCKI